MQGSAIFESNVSLDETKTEIIFFLKKKGRKN